MAPLKHPKAWTTRCRRTIRHRLPMANGHVMRVSGEDRVHSLVGISWPEMGDAHAPLNDAGEAKEWLCVPPVRYQIESTNASI
jgi:hypothetical protein